MSSGPRTLLTLRLSLGLTLMVPRLGASRWSAPLESIGATPRVRTRAVTPRTLSARNPRRTRDKGDMDWSPPVGGPLRNGPDWRRYVGPGPMHHAWARIP